MAGTEREKEKAALARERGQLLLRIEETLEIPMLVLGLVWLVLLIVELLWGLTPFLEAAGIAIWIVFVLDFIVELALAPRKAAYLARNWLTAIALVVPALRLFRIVRVFYVLRVARAARGMRLLRVVSSINRGMGALGSAMRRRGFGYVIALSVIVLFTGAAGMYAFERDPAGGQGLNDYGTALWWTAMVLTTMGSEYWPQTAEGRLLCLILALYAFTMFGYVTASLATFFIGRDAQAEDAGIAGEKSIEKLRAEIAALQADIRTLSRSSR